LLLCDKVFRVLLVPALADSKFIAYVLGCAPVRFQIEREATGASTMRNLGQDALGSLTVFIPPLAEQHQIVEWALEENKEIRMLLDETLASIGLLKEYRTALISAAVAGQIDVSSITTQGEGA